MALLNRYHLSNLIALIVTAIAPLTVDARDRVSVGGYLFPPYVDRILDAEATGLMPDALAELNRVQDRFEFRFVPTTAGGRYQDFRDGRFDGLLFEMPEWGWTNRGITLDVSEPFASDAEVYVARAAPNRDERYFDGLLTRRIAAILGYNYGFAGFRNDPEELRRRFDIALVDDHAATIDLVLGGDVEVGVVTMSYLRRHLSDHPGERGRLLISRRHDQVYAWRAVTRPGAVPSAAEISAMLTRGGALDALLFRHGVAR